MISTEAPQVEEGKSYSSNSSSTIGFENISIRKDRELKKKVLTRGNYLDFPLESAHVRVKISEVVVSNESGVCEVDEESLYFRNDFNGRIEVGMGECYLDMDLDRCLKQMSCGETSLVTMEYRNGKGQLARHVSCRVELVEISDNHLIGDWDKDRILEKAYYLKDRGVQMVGKGRVMDAFRLFSKAFKYICAFEPVDEAFPPEKLCEMLELKIKMFNNLAHCQLYFRQYNAALVICDKLLFLDETDIRGRYRRAVARMELQDWEGAHADILTVLQREPNNRAALQRLQALVPKIEQINKDYNEMIRKMFA